MRPLKLLQSGRVILHQPVVGLLRRGDLIATYNARLLKARKGEFEPGPKGEG